MTAQIQDSIDSNVDDVPITPGDDEDDEDDKDKVYLSFSIFMASQVIAAIFY
jgi:hypothetical protein